MPLLTIEPRPSLLNVDIRLLPLLRFHNAPLPDHPKRPPTFHHFFLPPISRLLVFKQTFQAIRRVTALPTMAVRAASRRSYGTYKSPFGPKYQTQPNFQGITASVAAPELMTAGALGVSLGTFALFFFADVPRVRIDIIEKVPFLYSFFHKEIAPEDHPF